MSRLFVKICGITSLEDALSAVHSGADAIGFNFYHASKRYLSIAQAASIFTKLPSKVLKVGVFVNPDRNEVLNAIEKLDIGAIQFSGNETPLDVSGYSRPVFKVIHVKEAAAVRELSFFKVDAYLLDTYREGEFGGTGEVFDWSIGRKANSFGNVIIAGGLTPENVADAVLKAKPYGVDVCSGVEMSPGKKDHKKIERFIKNARTASENLDRATHGRQ